MNLLALFPTTAIEPLVPTTEHNPAADELLAIRCQLGEPAAFEDLIARWHAPLWSFIRRLVGDDESARDIFQDVWVRVIRGIPQLRDGSKLRAWLFGITRRTVMDRLALAVGYATSSRSAIAAAALGVLMLLIATAMLVRAGRDVERLSKRREELERQLGRRLQ